MKNITLWQRLRQVSISTSLRCAFLMGALLTLIVSRVCIHGMNKAHKFVTRWMSIFPVFTLLSLLKGT